MTLCFPDKLTPCGVGWDRHWSVLCRGTGQLYKEFELGFLRGLLRIYSWIFEALLCLLGIGISIVSLSVGASDPVQVDWLPWNEATLPAWLIGLGILGLFLVFLAFVGRLRILLFLFAAVVFGLLARGFFFSTHTFEGPTEARTALFVVLGSLVAFLGAWPSGSKGRNYRSR
jgi:hypothetical protein